MSGFEWVPAYDEFQLMKAVTYGPVVISIAAPDDEDDADNDFFDYTGGVYQGPCGYNNDHEMLLVGYNDNYWILKNSNGEGWGEKGYMRLLKNVDSIKGMCGILRDGSAYPDLEDSQPQPGRKLISEQV